MFMRKVTILILIDGFLQYMLSDINKFAKSVTILILIDGFLQYKNQWLCRQTGQSHNPYFNRWFSAIKDTI